MNNAKLKAIEEGQTGIARKVLSVIPLAEAWNIHQIVTELARVGSKPDWRIVDGCLMSLTDAGLIKEGPRKSFTRVLIKDEPAPAPKPEKAPTPIFKLVESKRPFDRMAALAQRMREKANEFSAMAAEAEELALAFEEEVTKASKDGAKLKQLQELLRGLS